MAENNSYPFPTYSGLLTPEHRENIGPALWEFLWCISKTTKERAGDGEKYGIVLGGKPIKYSDIASDLGVSAVTVKRNMNRLKKHGYIEMKRAPYGEIITVRNSKKFREIKNDPSDSKRRIKNDLSGEIKNDLSDRDGSKVIHPDGSKMIKRRIKSDPCNKDIQDIKDKNDRSNDNWLSDIEQADDPILRDIEHHYITERGLGAIPSAIEREAIRKLLYEDKIPPEEIKAGFTQAFQNYKPKHRRDKPGIAYCETVVLNRYTEKKNRKKLRGGGQGATSRNLHGRNKTPNPIDPGASESPFARIVKTPI